MYSYNFYATLLDKFGDYLNSSRIYQEYWGFAENPEKSEEDFEKEQFQGLINTLNRVKFESELLRRFWKMPTGRPLIASPNRGASRSSLARHSNGWATTSAIFTETTRRRNSFRRQSLPNKTINFSQY